MTIRFGIIGAGRIAHVIADAIKQAHNAEITAVASRNHAGAQAFAQEHHISHAFASWQQLINDNNVDAVYIATPTVIREEICIAAANNKKHVLAEKPFMSTASFEKIAAACQENHVALVVYFANANAC